MTETLVRKAISLATCYHPWSPISPWTLKLPFFTLALNPAHSVPLFLEYFFSLLLNLTNPDAEEDYVKVVFLEEKIL